MTIAPGARGLATVVAVLIAVPTSAHAYLDAGTGSMLLQLLLGGLAGLGIAGKLYWQKVLAAIGLRKDRKDDATLETEAPRCE